MRIALVDMERAIVRRLQQGGSIMTTSKLVVLDSYADPLHAEVVAQRLNAAGIPTTIHGEIAFGVNPSHPDIKLEIAEEDLERARTILATPPEPDTSIQTEPDEPDTPEDLAATPTVADRSLRAALFGMLLLPIFVGMLFQLYSLWLATKVASRDEDESAFAWKVYLALAIDALGLVLGSLYVIAVGNRLRGMCSGNERSA